ncbi:histidine kinase [uncultured Aquimarina sp.]|uniref:histidine kinase n=1 Tax=uncultured Aquimarina sp. TaxID=575652 RepID=UPI00262BE773|nr:histidine kinase [uncultured Aquimarina sp.]
MERTIQFEDILIYFSKSILEKNNEEDVLWDLAKNCISKLGFLDCVIYLVDYKNKILIQKAAYGPKSPKENDIYNPVKIALGQGISGNVAITGIAEINNDTSLNSNYIIDDQHRLSEITVPIILENQVYGIIDCEHPDKNFFTEQHLSILSAIASFCSIKINSIRADKRLREEQENTLRIKQELVTLKLKAFRSQMNPHFVFNTLNAIQYFITSENKKPALEYLSTFSKLIRFYLKYMEKETVHLVDEISMLHGYLKFQKLRYEGQFDYFIDSGNQLENNGATIPSFMLQTLLENMIEQAMYKQHKNYTIHIRFKIMKDNVSVDIVSSSDMVTTKRRIVPHYRKQFLKWKDQIQLFNSLTDVQKQITFSCHTETNTKKIVLNLPNLH